MRKSHDCNYFKYTKTIILIMCSIYMTNDVLNS